MTLDDFQDAAGQTDGGHDPEYYALLTAAEAGEVVALFQKIRHGHPLDLERLTEEAGDLLWAVSRLLAKHGVGLEVAARQNLTKLEKRHPRGWSSERP